MKYDEWFRELEANLCGDGEEKRRVLDYYAEAYADRLAAGYTERQILEGFGAPRDAARAVYAGDDPGGDFESGSGGDFGEKSSASGKKSPVSDKKSPASGKKPPVAKEKNGQEPQKGAGCPTFTAVLLAIALFIPVLVVVILVGRRR